MQISTISENNQESFAASSRIISPSEKNNLLARLSHSTLEELKATGKCVIELAPGALLFAAMRGIAALGDVGFNLLFPRVQGDSIAAAAAATDISSFETATICTLSTVLYGDSFLLAEAIAKDPSNKEAQSVHRSSVLLFIILTGSNITLAFLAEPFFKAIRTKEAIAMAIGNYFNPIRIGGYLFDYTNVHLGMIHLARNHRVPSAATMYSSAIIRPIIGWSYYLISKKWLRHLPFNPKIMGYISATASALAFCFVSVPCIFSNKKNRQIIQHSIPKLDKNFIKLLYKGWGITLQPALDILTIFVAIAMIPLLKNQETDLQAMQINLQLLILSVLAKFAIGTVAGLRIQADVEKARYKKVSSDCKATTLLVLICGLPLLAILIIAPLRKVIFSLFNPTPEVPQLATTLFTINTIVDIIDSFRLSANGLLNGLNDMWFPTITNAIFGFAFGSTLSYFLGVNRGLGLPGICIGRGVAITATTGLNEARLFSRTKINSLVKIHGGMMASAEAKDLESQPLLPQHATVAPIN